MRIVAIAIALACGVYAQFRTSVPLVVAPATIIDSKGRYVDGLTPKDLVLYDNNVPQTAQMDWAAYPISLIVAVETSSNMGGVLDKLGGSGILFTQLIAAYRGETAIISFSDAVKVNQEFTYDSNRVNHALRMLRKEGGQARMLDAFQQALGMLEQRPPARRRIILMIAEKRDRGSHAGLPEVVERVERLNATVYWLSYSPFLESFTVKSKTAEDHKPEAERGKLRADEVPFPPDVGDGTNIHALSELIRMKQPDLASLFTRTTGGGTLSFLKRNVLEQDIQRIGEEVHRQYILSFQPTAGVPGQYHAIRVMVKNRPDLQVKAREGYWALE